MMKNKMVNKSFFALVMIFLLACIMPGESISIVLQAAPRTTSEEVGNGETDDEEDDCRTNTGHIQRQGHPCVERAKNRQHKITS